MATRRPCEGGLKRHSSRGYRMCRGWSTRPRWAWAGVAEKIECRPRSAGHYTGENGIVVITRRPTIVEPAAAPPGGGGTSSAGVADATDAALLGAFVGKRSEDAFAELVARHGP